MGETLFRVVHVVPWNELYKLMQKLVQLITACWNHQIYSQAKDRHPYIKMIKNAYVRILFKTDKREQKIHRNHTCKVRDTVRTAKKTIINPKPPMRRGLRPSRSITKPCKTTRGIWVSWYATEEIRECNVFFW